MHVLFEVHWFYWFQFTGECGGFRFVFNCGFVICHLNAIICGLALVFWLSDQSSFSEIYLARLALNQKEIYFKRSVLEVMQLNLCIFWICFEDCSVRLMSMIRCRCLSLRDSCAPSFRDSQCEDSAAVATHSILWFSDSSPWWLPLPWRHICR